MKWTPQETKKFHAKLKIESDVLEIAKEFGRTKESIYKKLRTENYVLQKKWVKVLKGKL